MAEIWETLTKLIGLCFLEEISSLLIKEERLGKTVRLVFGLLFIVLLLSPLWQMLQMGDILLQIDLEGLVD
ncbi:MAG: hypothetical protein PHD88_05835 [Firmicutes bacterium]|nr:hypothetical protein [Bacillota bacterium]MDD4693900.1 hypothetical protein [Bacillota bacterium]